MYNGRRKRQSTYYCNAGLEISQAKVQQSNKCGNLDIIKWKMLFLPSATSILPPFV